MVKPTKDAVKQVKKFLEEQFKLAVTDTLRPDGKAPGHLTVGESKTIIHVKGVQQGSATNSNAYFPRNFNELRNGETNFLVLVYKDINTAFILPKDAVEKIFGELKPNVGQDRKQRFVYRVIVKDSKHHVKCSSKGGQWIDIEDYKNRWEQIPDIGGRPIPQSEQSYCLMLHMKEDSNWNDKEGTEYHYGSNVPIEEKILPKIKALFFYRQDGKIILRGHGTIKSVTNYGFKGRTTPAGQQIEEKVAQIQCYDRFVPHKTLSPDLQSEVTSLKNYNSQYAVLQIAKTLYTKLVEKDPYPMTQLVKNTSVPTKTFEEWENILTEKKQAIIYGPPGTGKTFVASEFARYISAKYGGRFEILQFHPSYAYEDFIEGIKPRLVDHEITYEPADGTFKEFCKCVARSEKRDARYILIIDEINRGNLSKIFGELIYSLEYRGVGREIVLPYSKELFTIPDNVWIIGTMNSADRSIALVDYALRRRFYFIEFMPDAGILELYLNKKSKLGPKSKEKLIELFKAINSQISSNAALGPQYQIGHSYFMRENLTESLIQQIWSYAIKPILEEYFFENPSELNNLKSQFSKAFPVVEKKP